ncbi:MAG: IS256 family transposase [Anaerolineales bacterium]|nr:IS256 family transposase [Anaerolineales bacterium]
MLELITNESEKTAPEVTQSLDELAREGARRMIAAALETEVEEYLQKQSHLRDKQGHALVVRNGKGQERTLTMGAGAVKIRAPRVHDRRQNQRFTSKILPPYMRRSPRLEEALPVLYLRGLSTGDFQEALPVLLGPEAAGLSATTISRLVRIWQDEYRDWRKRSLVGKDYVYIWVDGVHFNVRLEEDRLACLVVIGVNVDGTKEVIALEDGYRESEESWASLLRDLKRLGMPAPMLAIGDGALGFWAAVRKVYPKTREQRCWVHKIRNVLDKLPKRLQPRAKDMLHEIMYAPDRESAREDIERFAEEYEARYPKAVECLLKDKDTLLTYFNFPAEHWIHLRTTNPIESPFATVKARTRQTKGAGSRKSGLAMAFKLALGAQDHWRKGNAPHLVELVRVGVEFKDGKQVAHHTVEEEELLAENTPMRIAA